MEAPSQYFPAPYSFSSIFLSNKTILMILSFKFRKISLYLRECCVGEGGNRKIKPLEKG